MKLHELKPAAGSRKERTRVGRGIAAGKGKTAGRGTKGQKSRAGAGIPAWFEGGQTPIHIRVPKLRGFKRRFRVEYQVINVGRISEYAAQGRFGVEPEAGKGRSRSASSDPQTVNAAVLAAAGLIRSESKPLKVLGQGEVEAKLFVAADAFTDSARRKIEQAGGFVQLLASPQAAEGEEGAEEPAGQPEAPRTASAPGAPDQETASARTEAPGRAQTEAPGKAQTEAAAAPAAVEAAVEPAPEPAAGDNQAAGGEANDAEAADSGATQPPKSRRRTKSQD